MEDIQVMYTEAETLKFFLQQHWQNYFIKQLSILEKKVFQLMILKNGKNY